MVESPAILLPSPPPKKCSFRDYLIGHTSALAVRTKDPGPGHGDLLDSVVSVHPSIYISVMANSEAGHSSDECQPGCVIGGRYRLESLIGTGGTSSVYRATHVGTGRAVAVKILDKELISNPFIVKRFLREGQTATKVS